MPDRQDEIRHGLVENAAGQLKCPICREPVRDVVMVAATTGRAHAMVTPMELRTSAFRVPGEDGIQGAVIGLACAAGHQSYLSLLAAEGYVTVKTQWEVPDGGDDGGDD